MLIGEIFPLPKEKKLPVKSEPEVSPETKPDFKVSLNWQEWLADKKQGIEFLVLRGKNSRFWKDTKATIPSFDQMATL